MKTVGIIAECNPLHNGHTYLFSKARELAGADYLVVVLSGDFVQRGEPALLSKHKRCEMLLKSGVDLVLEMPTIFATGSAEYFARCGVSILHHLGCVDTLCFGSEDGSLSLLREKANAEELAKDSPNNILGIAYLKALSHFQSSMEPLTIKREGAGYHDLEENASYPSASAIRKACLSNPGTISSLPGLPDHVKAILSNPGATFLSLTSFDSLIGCHLQGISYENLASIFDIYPNLADKIYKNQRLYMDASQFVTCLKSKDIAYSHLQRALLHMVLGYTKEDAEIAMHYDYAPYARILGMRKSAKGLLHQIKKSASLPLINKPAKAGKELPADALSLLQKDFAASHIYSLLSYGKIVSEETISPIVL